MQWLVRLQCVMSTSRTTCQQSGLLRPYRGLFLDLTDTLINRYRSAQLCTELSCSWSVCLVGPAAIHETGRARESPLLLSCVQYSAQARAGTSTRSPAGHEPAAYSRCTGRRPHAKVGVSQSDDLLLRLTLNQSQSAPSAHQSAATRQSVSQSATHQSAASSQSATHQSAVRRLGGWGARGGARGQGPGVGPGVGPGGRGQGAGGRGQGWGQ